MSLNPFRKIYPNWEDAKEDLKKWKKNNETIVFTNGCFDIIHAGHIHFLNEANKLGHRFIIGLNSDRSVQILKGDSRPVNSQTDRAIVLASLELVDFVMIFDDQDPLEIIKFIMPDVLVKGGDWAIDKIIGAKEVLNAGGIVKSIRFLEGYSTTSLIDKIRNENKNTN